MTIERLSQSVSLRFCVIVAMNTCHYEKKSSFCTFLFVVPLSFRNEMYFSDFSFRIRSQVNHVMFDVNEYDVHRKRNESCLLAISFRSDTVTVIWKQHLKFSLLIRSYHDNASSLGCLWRVFWQPRHFHFDFQSRISLLEVKERERGKRERGREGEIERGERDR